MKIIFIAIAFVIPGCGFFGGPELYQERSGATVFKSTSDDPSDIPTATPAPQKVPGESR